ncbi:hypothetical protein EGT44_02370 [Burkholderia cenocepacia]|nr:hypothetical protein EGT44_02370 [Burkholderia cenocepacia]
MRSRRRWKRCSATSPTAGCSCGRSCTASTRGRCVSGKPERAHHAPFRRSARHAPHPLHASRTTNAHRTACNAHGTHLAPYISDTRRTQNSAVLR